VPAWTTGIAGPGTRGGPRNTGLFRVPHDMIGMIINPARTVRKSKDIPLSGIVFWYGLVMVIHALILGITIFLAVQDKPEIESIMGSAFRLGVQMFSGEIIAFLMVTGFATGTFHILSHAWGGIIPDFL
jgi:hypothetical protein